MENEIDYVRVEPDTTIGKVSWDDWQVWVRNRGYCGENKMVIYLDGRTSLNNNYVVRDVQRSKINRSDEVMKSAKKCAKKLIAIAKIHAIISKGMYAYMITSTYGDGIDIYKRRYIYI